MENNVILANTLFNNVLVKSGFTPLNVSLAVDSKGWALIAKCRETSTRDRLEVWYDTKSDTVDVYIGNTLVDNLTSMAQKRVDALLFAKGGRRQPSQTRLRFKSAKGVNDVGIVDALLFLNIARKQPTTSAKTAEKSAERAAV